jgi:ATP-binding cassette subfamily B protein
MPKQYIAAQFRRIFAQLSHLPQTFALVWQAARLWTIAWSILLIVQGILPALTVSLTRLLVDRLAGAVGAGVSAESIHSLIVPAGLMAGLLLLSEALSSANEWVYTAQAELVQDYVNGLVHKKSVEADFGFYESSEFYDRLDRARGDASGRSLSLVQSTGSLLQNSITLLAMAAILLPYGLWLPIILFVSTLPAFYIILLLNKCHHKWWQRTTLDRRLLQYYDLLLTQNMPAAELRLFGLGSYFQNAYQTLRHRLRGEHLQLIKTQSLGRLGAGLIALFLLAGALSWMGWQVLRGALTLGDLALFYQAFNKGQGLMKTLLANLGQLYKNSLFINDFFQFLQLESTVIDPPHPKPVPDKFQEGIRFNNVTFQYSGSDRPVLKDFNLLIPAGKVVAIVGDNGAGKSTLIKLLCRFYDPQSGSVEFDGVSLREFTVESVRRMITVLFQSPLPYYVTAGQNIALGDLGLDTDTDLIEAAAKGAGIHNKIASLPQGYESMLGKLFPGGTELSGGQWQRLALARAFYRQAQLIILDEPTSAMDPWAEFDWLKRFRSLANGRTSVIITHRFTLAMRADIIHLMRDGQIVESGTHDELVALGGLYAQSWQTQMEFNPTTIEAPT